MPAATRHFLFLLSSTRRLGNSEQLAYCAAHTLPANTAQQWLHLLDFPLPDFVDLRHNGPFLPPTGHAQFLLDATLHATDLVLVAPLYWYSLPATAKLYLDHWQAWLRTPELDFRARMQGKTLWSIVVGSGEATDARPLADALILTAQHLRLHWGGLLFGKGSHPNDIQGDGEALLRAQSFFAGVQQAHLATEAAPERK